MAGFLYSFAAKDIQNYILKSDKLAEMVGASELIDNLCREGGFLQKTIDDLGIAEEKYEIITKAAGWAKIKFENEADAATLYKYWPLAVSFYAPGLHIVQSLIAINGALSSAINESEKQLIYARNTLDVDMPEAGPLIDRNQRTGLAATGRQAGDAIDKESKRKRDIKANALIKRITGIENDANWPTDLDHIAGEERKYIAIIHADGNSLGKTLISIQDYLNENQNADAADVFRGFSNAIEEATLEAVRVAYETVILTDFEDRKTQYKAARPIILGGDDLTIITRADLAFDFTEVFLCKFEETSKAALQKFLGKFKKLDLPKILTACAGIAFVKKAYPFSRAYELSESLCKDAKKIAKAKQSEGKDHHIPSCFSFCKISTSIAGDYQTIKEKELTSRDGRIKLWLGPYSVGLHSNGLPKYEHLRILSDTLGTIPSGSIRQLATTIYSNMADAQNDYSRILQVLRRDNAKAKHADALEKGMDNLTGMSGSLFTTEQQTPLIDAIRHRELQK
ncbi:MAG: hypothetical protein JW943_10535 [Deltaproteobacteria bacterium]|nr:hypothetical protein [Deltaproteobacteria bacterium]